MIILHSSHSLTCIPPNHIREIQKEKTKVLFWVQLPHHYHTRYHYQQSVCLDLEMYVNWLQDISWRKHWYLILQMMKIVSIRAPSSFASLTLLEKVELWNWKRAKSFTIFLLCNEVEINMKYDIKNCCVVNWSLRLFVRPWYFWHKVYTFFFPILRTDKNAEHLQQSQSKRNQRTYWILLTDFLLICTSRTVILTVRLALLGA